MVPELQYGARRLAAGPAAARRRRRSRPAGAAAGDGDLEVRDLTFTYADAVDDGAGRPALRDVHLTFAPRPLVRGDRPHRLGQVEPGEGADPGGRRAPRHRLPRRRRPARPRPRGPAPLDRRRSRSAPRSSPARWRRTSRCSTPSCCRGPPRALDELGLATWVAELPDGLRDPARRRRARAVGRPGAARRVRADPRPRPARGHPRRGDRADGPGHRGARCSAPPSGCWPAASASSSRTGCRRCSRCDEVVVLADGEVVEAGPLHASEHFARAARAQPADVRRARRRAGRAAGGDALRERPDVELAVPVVAMRRAAEVRPAAAAAAPRPARCGRSSGSSTTTRATGWPRSALFIVLVVLGLDGSVLPWLWARPRRRRRQPCSGRPSASSPPCSSPIPMPYYTARLVPAVVGHARCCGSACGSCTGRPARAGSAAHTPAEVVAQGGDTERVVHARRQRGRPDDQRRGRSSSMTLVSGSVVPAAVLRRHDAGVRAGGDAVRAAARQRPRSAPWPPGPRSRRPWCRRCPRRAR